MVETTAEVKNDEHFPLLMVTGAGDATALRTPSAAESLGATTFLPERRRWGSNLPEYISTCWMTCILLAISFLIFYGIGMVVVYRQNSLVVTKCNTTLSTKDVFYHYIVPRGEKIPLKAHSNFLSNMASEYPRLRFKIYILIDDSDRNNLSVFEKLTGTACSEFNLYNRREIERLLKHPNIYLSVMYLSKFMAMTPLKRTWKDIPLEYIPFYARVFSVFVYGGVGLDLDSLNYKDGFPTRSLRTVNRNVDAILTQHSNGITAEKYEETLNRLSKDDGTEIMAIFFTMAQKMINETMAFFNEPFGMSAVSNTSVSPEPPKRLEPLVRAHRAKRDLSTEKTPIDNNSTIQAAVINIILGNSTFVNASGEENKKNIYQISPTNDTAKVPKTNKSTSETFMPDNSYEYAQILDISDGLGRANKNKPKPENSYEYAQMLDISNSLGRADKNKPKPDSSYEYAQILDIANSLGRADKNKPKPDNSYEFSQILNISDIFGSADKNKPNDTEILLFYDVSIFPEIINPMPLAPLHHISSRRRIGKKLKPVVPEYVAINADGIFIASTSSLHPFLDHILLSECKNLPPKYVIQNALLSYCNANYREVPYCNRIYVL